ncbi:MAG: flagellin [Myxococcota bacterium]|jgi:flagellin
MAIGSLGASSAAGTRSLNTISRSLTKSLEKLSSGSRIPRASFDAAGLAVSESLKAATASLAQGVRNLNDGISAARVAEGALDESSNILGRLRELSIQSQNGTLNAQQKQTIQQEFDSLTDQVSKIAASTNFNGSKLLDGGSGGNIEVVDGTGGEAIELAVDDQSASALGVEGLDASDPASLAKIDQAIRSVSSSRANLGASENRISSQIRTQMVAIENTMQANSQIRDADFASETSELMKNKILRDASLAVRGQANVGASVAIKLLGTRG